jgi:hypothetical protein
MATHIEKPGTGVLYWEPEEKRTGERSPHYKGFLLLDRDYKAGEKVKIAAWSYNTSRGTTLLSLKEDTASKDWRANQTAMENAPKEDTSGYQKEAYGRVKKTNPNYTGKPPVYNRDPDFDSGDVPF